MIKGGGGMLYHANLSLYEGIGKQFDAHVKKVIQFQFNFITDNKCVGVAH